MPKECISHEEKREKACKPIAEDDVKHQVQNLQAEGPSLTSLQQIVGNRAVQRLLAQRSGEGSTSASLSAGFELDDDTAGRIDRERGGGQALDTALQTQAGEAMGYDLSGVRVHTSPEAAGLSDQLSAKAFTTGQDIFFREGAYDPHSSGGRELIAHELTHVVQQGTGAVGGGSRLTVNPPGDAFEQEADAVAKAVASGGAGAGVQRQVELEEEESAGAASLQMQELEEEEQV